eukprot:CAMPEP_0194515578 /NCGR_PEP_ID=MMETSP0253-20130528/48306_1 /TAXON_ID=2966 /ORGANISM="Noctiluca scintillans" /LENGTH=61 /DNA_ID=CAMNT_0039359345 /DNA_START=682 /DNA_END=867 /DNA_ORIENTATION=-
MNEATARRDAHRPTEDVHGTVDICQIQEDVGKTAERLNVMGIPGECGHEVPTRFANVRGTQ